MEASPNTITLIELVLAVLLPPLAVFLKVGLDTPFWINLLLTLLGYLPGIAHALWLVYSS